MHAKEEVIFTIIIVIFVLVFLAILFLVIVARNNTRKNKLLFENERIKKEFEKTLLNTKLEIQEQTLSHVSQEIHDNIGQALSLVRLQLNSSPEDLENTDELLGKAITDLRILSHSLNTNHVKEQGFISSLKNLLHQLEKTKLYKIHFSFDDFENQMSDEESLILFRIIQEVLNNITKHANATVINIKLATVGSKSEIYIADNGKGFDISTVKANGLGLKNISERVKIIGGKLHISSNPGKGTEIKISL